MRRFRIDVDGRCVAQAVLFDDGTIAARSIREVGVTSTTQFFASLAVMRQSFVRPVVLRWEDKCCFACGATAERPAGPGGCLSCGSTWDSPADEVEPSGGTWVLAAEFKAEHVP